MQRLKTLTEIYQKRLIRPEYAHHQATPYAIALDPSFFNTDGSLRVPTASDVGGTTVTGGSSPAPFTRSAAAFTLSNSLVPGTVMVKVTGAEATGVATGTQAAAEQPFGLLANWVAGDFDEIGPNNVGSGVLGVWRGPDSTYTLLAPGFNDTGAGNTSGQSLTAAITANVNTGLPVKLYAGVDGRLFSCSAPTATMQVVAHLIDRPSAGRIVIDLRV